MGMDHLDEKACLFGQYWLKGVCIASIENSAKTHIDIIKF